MLSINIYLFVDFKVMHNQFFMFFIYIDANKTQCFLKFKPGTCVAVGLSLLGSLFSTDCAHQQFIKGSSCEMLEVESGGVSRDGEVIHRLVVM